MGKINLKITFPIIFLITSAFAFIPERQMVLHINVTASPKASSALKAAVENHVYDLSQILISVYDDYDIRNFFRLAEESIEEVVKMPVRVDTDQWEQRYAHLNVSLRALMGYSLRDLGITSKKSVSIAVE